MQQKPQPRSRRGSKGSTKVKRISLALQGGGSHGAFAWGVLDRLLEEQRVEVEAVSATSAGAMNAVVMAYGVSTGGREGAKAKLAEFWRAIADSGRLYSPIRVSPFERWLHAHGVEPELSPSFLVFQAMTQLFSPYQLNPLDFNPLRTVLERVVDFRRLAECPIATRLYLSATNVRTGKIKVFENKDLSAKAVLASACLPYLFQAVEVDGEHYWDGGYMGNPAIFPLIYRQGTRDVVVVHINPLARQRLPTTAPEILDRINEISFNSSLMREMRAIAFVTRLIDDGAIDAKRYSRMLIHSIRDDDALGDLGAASKLDADIGFLEQLMKAGRNAAAAWLERDWDAVGSRSSVNLTEVYL